ncbi:MAG: hypothetical protein ACFFCI_06125 [Promethearchaeota archaeon]
MRKKVALIEFICVLLLLINVISYVNATDYRVGVKSNQELIWRCNVCKKREMDNIFGNNWNELGNFENLNKGYKMKWKILNTEVNEIFIRLNFSVWGWTNGNTWGVKDRDFQITFFSNPNEYSTEINFSNYASFVPFWFPIPVGEYLGGLSLYEWYDIDNRVLPTLNIDIEKDAIIPGFPSKDIKIIAIYNDQGILNSYKLYITGNVVIIDISLYSLPVYVIPTLISLTLGLSLSLIVYIIKKRRSKLIS